MSNVWKIVQGLKKENQNKSFDSEKKIIDYISKCQDAIRQHEEEEWNESWNTYTDAGLFDESFENDNIKMFENFIQECRKNNIPLKAKRGDVSFSIESQSPLKVSFTAKDRDSDVIVNDNEVLYSQIEAGKEKWHTRYKNNIPTSLIRSIYVVRDERTSRY